MVVGVQVPPLVPFQLNGEYLVVIDNKKDLRNKLNFIYMKNEVLSLVPTMGNLHNGHLSLLKIAKKNSTTSIVTIFVNPLQFGKNEDFDQYPRTIVKDINILKHAGCDILYLPKNKYEVFDNRLNIDHLHSGKKGNILCGKIRKGHFDGVLKVVYTLFKLIKPNVAVFGNKDYQQLYLIENMSNKYFKNLKILRGETIRDKNGLALSSRNSYLNKNQMAKAPLFYKFLKKGIELVKQSKDQKIVKMNIKQLLEKNDFTVEYLEFLNTNLDIFKYSLEINTKKVFLGSVKLGSTKLIDNIEFY